MNKDYLVDMMIAGVCSACVPRQTKDYRINQSPRELEALCLWIARNNIKSYLEIGLGVGGTWTFLSEQFGFSPTAGITLMLHPYYLKDMKIPTNGLLLIADSHTDAAESFAKKHGPFDLVFHDGLHTYEGMLGDYEMYKKVAKYMCFHDIAGNWGTEQLDTPKAWQEIKQKEKLIAEWIDQVRPIGIGLVEIINA